MTTAYLADTPDRLLKRVQQLEDMELPSLPSFQHDIDYESGSVTEADTSMEGSNQSSQSVHDTEKATPHPLRRSFLPHLASSRTGSNASSATSTGSPFPPLSSAYRGETPSPYVPGTALTSTPHTVQSKELGRSVSDETRTTFRKSVSHQRTRSGTADLGSNTTAGRDRWQTPGQMSRSFAIEDIEIDNVYNEGPQNNEIYQSPEANQAEPTQAPTPFARRLSAGNVVLDRRGKRSSSNTFLPLQPLREVKFPSPIASINDTPATKDLEPEIKERIPSLSRSEVSDAETSNAASTPEGPSRNPQIATPRSHNAVRSTARRINWDNLDAETDGDQSVDRSGDDQYQSEHDSIMPPPSLGSMIQADLPSPAKMPQTPAYSTPGFGRLESRHNSPSHFCPTPRAGPLKDITSTQNTPEHAPFTPAPASNASKYGEISTPRAPLDDAERRKNHVLAVLSSTGLPARVFRSVKGTPHPLRRVSTAPATDSILENSIMRDTPGRSPAVTLQERSKYYADASQVTSITSVIDESFVSIASSADLTSDRRATHQKQALSRGNTSFPTILLPTNNSAASPGSSMRGPGDHRADGVKIHKHLNAMNKQLLESNGDLAREAEAWRGEVDRLMGLLNEAGIHVEESNIAAQMTGGACLLVPPSIANGTRSDSSEVYSADASSASLANHTRARSETLENQLSAILQRRRSATPGEVPEENGFVGRLSPEEQEAILEEMAERLETLEAGLDEKDQLIANLEQRLVIQSTAESYTDHRQIIEDLRHKLDEAEQTRVQLHSDFANKTELHARQFGEICTSFEEQVASLEMELQAAQSVTVVLRQEIEELRLNPSSVDAETSSKVSTLEAALEQARAELLDRTKEIQTLQAKAEADIARHRELVLKVELAESRLNDAQDRLDNAGEAMGELEELRAKLDELSAVGANSSNGREEQELRTLNQELEAQLSDREEELRVLSGRLQELEGDVNASEQESKAVEKGLSAELDRLNALLSESNRILAQKDAELETARAQQMDKLVDAAQNEAVAAMETHLEDAFREIGRLKQQLSSSPHLKSTMEVKEARIQALERERAALKERLASSREATPGRFVDAGSPFKATPFVNKALASLRMPKTPGSIQDLSWLHTTVGDANEPILRAQIEQLQDELDNANSQLDSNFSRLEAAGMNGIRLAEDLAVAQDRISELEDELRALSQRNTASLALLTEQREIRSREGDDRLRSATDSVRQQMETLQNDLNAERARLQKENTRLTSMVSELRRDHAIDLQAVKSDSDRDLATSQAELRKVKQELAAAFRERDTLKRKLAASSTNLQELGARLERTQDKLDEAQSGLREMAPSGEIEIQRRIVDQLQDSLETAESNIEQLRDLAQQRQTALQAAEAKVNRLQGERRTIVQGLAEFEQDLNIQRRESQKFGVELQKLKVEQQGSASKQASELAAAEREARLSANKLHALEEEIQELQQIRRDLELRSVARSADVQTALEKQKASFKLQTHELAVQIRYLKAKFSRESTFRNGLSLQKKYLLLLVGGMSLNEQATLKQIASMGFPVPELSRKHRSLKSVGLAVVGLIRAKNGADKWRAEREVKSGVVAAREDRKRAI